MTQEAEELEDAISTRKALVKPLSALVGLLTSKFIAIALAVAALAAALVEVFEDVSPGGHHGAVLLAINELLEILETARLVKGQFLLHIMRNHLLRLAIVGGATAFALVEALSSVGSKKIGAHHGVLLLASSKTLRCLGLLRSRLKEKKA
jgi:hypothetical protein